MPEECPEPIWPKKQKRWNSSVQKRDPVSQALERRPFESVAALVIDPKIDAKPGKEIRDNNRNQESIQM